MRFPEAFQFTFRNRAPVGRVAVAVCGLTLEIQKELWRCASARHAGILPRARIQRGAALVRSASDEAEDAILGDRRKDI